ncbi:hypothetical protein CPB84DRAFT_1755013 [Gymnopilus junonius]|uniref:Ribonuclease H1 N-terminal domain-containing protein n=1 Tax=Gymnopilus junonius TaxID=109634 RepID=A0A9P5N7D1_GYMJU|nr:hypothetical protein CPB84DRAFT_1755013 [Gymnopilus junonius]
MNPSTQTSDGLSEGRPSDTSLGTFVKELAVTLREVNSLDGVLNENVHIGVETADDRSLVLQPPVAAEADNYVVIPATEGNADTATAAVPSAASGSNTVIAAPIHAPRWYAVVVGRNPGIFQGSTDIPSNIDRIPGGLALKFETEAEARAKFDDRLRAGLVKRVNLVISEAVVSFDEYHAAHQ